MKFAIVAEYFKRIEEEPSRVAMAKLLASLFAESTPEESVYIANLALGQVEPAYVRSPLNMAEKSVVKALARTINCSESAIFNAVQEAGDLGLVAEQKLAGSQGTLTLVELYNGLVWVSNCSGPGSQEERIALVGSLLKNVDALSSRYIVRIIVGKLRLGFSDMTVLDALSYLISGDKSARPIIEESYNRCADIGRVAYIIKKGGLEELREMVITVGIPIRPASAERLPTVAEIIKKIGPCVAEPKIDGFRLQIHLKRDSASDEQKVWFFSRNLTPMSEMFPELVDAFKKMPCIDMICEGEAIAYDRETGTFLPFQETVKRKRKHSIAEMVEAFPVRVFMFDLLYYNGNDLLAVPLRQRRAQLVASLKSCSPDSPLQLIEEVQISTQEQLDAYFQQMVEQGLEGIIVKRQDSLYQAGKRNFNWVKLKRHKGGTLEDTVDCVLLGYYRGSGKRTGFGIGAFLIGVYNKEKDAFETIAKVGTGLSDSQWSDLKSTLDKITVGEKPKNVICSKELYPHIWVYPEIVCSIRADEITISPLHSAGKSAGIPGYALRFPRFVSYRPDKSPTEATTTDEITSLYSHQRVFSVSD